MPNCLTFLGIHVGLLVLASTRFSIVTGLRDGHYQWEYFRYIFQHESGIVQHSDYGLSVVLAYLAAYAIGVAAYRIAYRCGSPIIGTIGMLICAVGVASFTFELTHWVASSSVTWIISPPIVLLALAPVAAIRQYRRRGRAIPS